MLNVLSDSIAIRYMFVCVYMPENCEIPFGIGCLPFEKYVVWKWASTKGLEKKNFDLINF